MNQGFFKRSETSGALTASGGASDLPRSENDKRTEEEKESSGPVIVSSATLIGRKENGLLMETHTSRLMHMWARRQQRVSACESGGTTRFCCQRRFGFNNRLTGSKQKLAKNRRVGPIYFTVNDTSAAITACDECSAVQPEAPGGSNNSMSVSPAATFSQRRLETDSLINRATPEQSGCSSAQVLAPVCRSSF